MAILEEVNERGVQAQGRRELIKHLEGGKLNKGQALKAFCYECLGFYQDGKIDCETPSCPLYPWMPYNPNRQRQKRPWVKGSKTPGVKKQAGKAS